jgi:hypothetical protein
VIDLGATKSFDTKKD